MIPGDIDLTENLDFRKSRRKEIPALPWDKFNETTINNNIIINEAPEIIYDSNTYMINAINADGTIRYNNVSLASLMNNFYYDNIISGWTTFDLYYNDINDITTTNTIKHKYSLSWNNEKPKKDVFGNMIISEEPIKKIPWNKKSKQLIRKIPWNREDTIRNYGNNITIPWYRQHITPLELSSWQTLKHKFDKVDYICYLEGKSSRFIDDYFHKKDNSSYLTNMGFIGVHDAIIE